MIINIQLLQHCETLKTYYAGSIIVREEYRKHYQYM